MKLFKWAKDGGPDSNVWGFFIVEIKPLFSIVLLKFEDEPEKRRNLHSHAFNALTWFLKGSMYQTTWDGKYYRYSTYRRKLFPKITPRSLVHKVMVSETSWAISIRGPWQDTWNEFDPETGEYILLTHGRREVGRWQMS
jgi:hypothetical protein